MLDRSKLRLITVVISLAILVLIPVAVFVEEDYSYLITVGLAAYTLYINLKYN